MVRAIEALKDIRLAELSALLHHDYGASFAISSVHRLLVRHRITLRSRHTPAQSANSSIASAVSAQQISLRKICPLPASAQPADILRLDFSPPGLGLGLTNHLMTAFPQV